MGSVLGIIPVKVKSVHRISIYTVVDHIPTGLITKCRTGTIILHRLYEAGGVWQLTQVPTSMSMNPLHQGTLILASSLLNSMTNTSFAISWKAINRGFISVITQNQTRSLYYSSKFDPIWSMLYVWCHENNGHYTWENALVTIWVWVMLSNVQETKSSQSVNGITGRHTESYWLHFLQ